MKKRNIKSLLEIIQKYIRRVDVCLWVKRPVTSRRVGPVRPVRRVEHVRRHVVLVPPVDQLGRVVAGEPAVHRPGAAVEPPALPDHRHRAPLHLQHGGRLLAPRSRQPRQAHVLVQELT